MNPIIILNIKSTSMFSLLGKIFFFFLYYYKIVFTFYLLPTFQADNVKVGEP